MSRRSASFAVSSSARRSAASPPRRDRARAEGARGRRARGGSPQRRLERVHLDERGTRALDLGERDGPIEPHDRRPVVPQQHVVEGQHLQPVGVGRGRASA